MEGALVFLPAVAVCVLFSVIESEEFDDEEDDDEEDVVAEEEDDDDDDDSEDDEVSRAACLCQAFRGKLLPRQMQLKLQEKHLKSCNRIWDWSVPLFTCQILASLSLQQQLCRFMLRFAHV